MEKKEGVYYAPCAVNGLKLNAIIDTNAIDVSVSLSEVDFMIKKNLVKKDADFIVTGKYNVTKDGVAEGTRIIIRKLEIGDKTLYNIEASIVDKLSAPLLLGQNAIKKLGTFSINNTNSTLTINNTTPPPNNQKGSTFTDPRDGKTYRTVEIGNQTWMAENLNCYTTIGSWCYNNNIANCDKYGRLYNEEAAKKSCPKGWHLPSDEEWNTFINYLGGDEGIKLKSTSGWNSDGNGTDVFGFTALPGGYRGFTDIHFNYIGDYGFWWSSTESSTIGAWSRYISNDHSEVYRIGSDNKNGFSVRCIRN